MPSPRPFFRAIPHAVVEAAAARCRSLKDSFSFRTRHFPNSPLVHTSNPVLLSRWERGRHSAALPGTFQRNYAYFSRRTLKSMPLSPAATFLPLVPAATRHFPTQFVRFPQAARHGPQAIFSERTWELIEIKGSRISSAFVRLNRRKDHLELTLSSWPPVHLTTWSRSPTPGRRKSAHPCRETCRETTYTLLLLRILHR